MVTDAGEPIVAAGEYKLFIGGGQPNESTAGVYGKFVVKSTMQLPE
jgi:beta-glucosidase